MVTVRDFNFNKIPKKETYILKISLHCSGSSKHSTIKEDYNITQYYLKRENFLNKLQNNYMDFTINEQINRDDIFILNIEGKVKNNISRIVEFKGDKL